MRLTLRTKKLNRGFTSNQIKLLKNRIENLKNKQKTAETRVRLMNEKEKERTNNKQWAKYQRSRWDQKKKELKDEENVKHFFINRYRNQQEVCKIKLNEQKSTHLTQLQRKTKQERIENEKRKQEQYEKDLEEKRLNYCYIKSNLTESKHFRDRSRLEYEDNLRKRVINRLNKQKNSHKKLMSQVDS